MKKCLNLIYIILLVSCTELASVIPMTVSDIEQNSYKANRDSNRVSIHDVYDVLSRDFPNTKAASGIQEYDITSYVSNGNDTLMYIVNTKADGWKIYSSDKRVPAVLAEGYRGSFSIEEGSPAVAVWLDCVARDMERVHRSSDAELTFKKDEIEANKFYWTHQTEKLENNGQRLTDSLVILPPGHWEEVTYTSVERDSVVHMVPKWDQWEPYNECCPYYVNEPNSRACAGCVSIAGAQILYYLHNKLGVPASMYSHGSCVGNVDGFQKLFSSLSESVWDQMSIENQSSNNTSSVIPEAILISYVGQLVNMHYCENGIDNYSWALPRNIKDNVLDFYGITSSHENYDEDIVANSLLKGMPVIVSATDLLIPVDFDIHCFVIDGYKSERTKYTHHHYYVIESPPDQMITMPPKGYSTYTYSSSRVTAIKINWGWWSQWDSQDPKNDGWYALTGGWTVTNSGDTYDYNYNRKIIHGFEIADQ